MEDRAPTDAEMEEMEELVRMGMEEGALGCVGSSSPAKVDGCGPSCGDRGLTLRRERLFLKVLLFIID